MLDKFIAACATWQRAAESSWITGPIGVLNGAWVALILSVLWIGSPFFALGGAVLVALAWHFLGRTKAHNIGACIGALLTVAAELALFVPRHG